MIKLENEMEYKYVCMRSKLEAGTIVKAIAMVVFGFCFCITVVVVGI